MLEKFIKKDSNEILENVLAQKDVDERTKNLLQGILYKIDVSYKDYQNAKVIQRNKKEYVDEINKNIKRKCNKIVTVSFNEKIEEEKIKKSLEKNKFYIDENQIITYPIEEKILYAIEKSINNNKIVNSKYEIISEPLSNLIMTGKSLDRVEVLRDFNGWSWTTIKTEIESISSNLVYQILQILLGEEFMDNWSFDTDGIIDYYSMFKEQISNKYGIENAKKLYEIIEKIAIMNEIEQDIYFKSEKIQQLNEIDNDIKKRTNVEQYITELTEEKKKAEKEIAVIQKILSSEKELKNQYQKVNEGVPIEKKVFSVRVLRQQLNAKKQENLKNIEDINFKLLPYNYVESKEKITQKKNLLETIYYTEEEQKEVYLKFVITFLECFKQEIKNANKDTLLNLIYKFRYYMLIPFNTQDSIKDISELKEEITEIEKELIKIGKKEKIVSKEVPFEVWTHIFETRIIDLKELYYKIFAEYDKKYFQLFDENISEEKFIINNIEKNKINKKIKIFN